MYFIGKICKAGDFIIDKNKARVELIDVDPVSNNYLEEVVAKKERNESMLRISPPGSDTISREERMGDLREGPSERAD